MRPRRSFTGVEVLVGRVRRAPVPLRSGRTWTLLAWETDRGDRSTGSCRLIPPFYFCLWGCSLDLLLYYVVRMSLP